MEEELSFLRRKVNRLEDMIFNINDKIGLILEKFLNHRASNVAGIREVLQFEEDICLSLVTQLKSSVINCSSNRSDDRNSAINNTMTRSNAQRRQAAPLGPTTKSPVTSVSLPRVVLTRQVQSFINATTHSTRPDAPNKKRMQITDDDASEPEQDPLIYLEEEEPNPNQQNLFTVKVETDQQQQQIDIGFQPEDGRDCEPCNISEEEDDAEDSDKDDPDYRAGSTTTSANPNPKKACMLSRSFSSLDEAKAQIKAEDQFHVHTRMYTSSGMKMYYNCRHDGKCPVKMHLVVNEETGTVDEYVSPDPPPHSHRQKVYKYGGLGTEVKAVVDEIYLRASRDSDLRTVDKLQEELMRRGFEEQAVPKHKIRNYLARLKKKKFGDLSFMRRRKPKSTTAESTAMSMSTSTNSDARSTGGE